MAVIHVLDKHTAELIAAGEVVERPASVVKELTENAIDAGATAVSVSVERGGIAMIQIADNGCGIEAEYIPTAFIRHATSKIEKEEDLESIHTLGFRGEALASVASVSRIELLTKTDADEYAYLYRISGGEEQGIEPAARPVGTTITVRDLFYNTPARMKFLKKDTSEGNYVADVVTQLALSHPEVSFKFVRDGKPQFQTPGDGKLLGAAYAVLSRDFAKDLVPVEHTAGSYTVRGLVTPPKNARASRAMQYFFINGRFVKNRTMMAALEAGADDLESADDGFEVSCDPNVLSQVAQTLKGAGYNVETMEVQMVPKNTVAINNKSDAAKMLAMVERFEDHDDVQAVYANFDIPDEILSQLD